LQYDRHFADDAEVDLITLRTYNARDESLYQFLNISLCHIGATYNS